MTINLFLSLVGLFISLSSIMISFLTFRNKMKNDVRSEGKNEAIIISEIGYIKACLDRLEKNISMIDERNHDFFERLTKTEVLVSTMKKSINK